ncbi:nucleotidyltransferase domain-containing protein [Streptomyces caniscabiei]|uniref:nucleotidyltransferase domain-containing protein n=1 Tax=Streptomyces caniscabiei TaxID=2746961 RepID=UPI00299FC6F6|nr:nucleotidyltransferase domain-containing protein [Streptomyces caniscabiei]MDX2605184.1 nucleotidyltransferase domain-containing protein [Streptomyces caniscabiei]MDX2738342.1 nucleotidyltransferase domain-containing protein [Streptomyces caniscabiei]MDX2778934.1 nucleotidyltransferase domain-containing protein [Streptomyces caniscabiei]
MTRQNATAPLPDTAAATAALLERFLDELGELAPLAVWAHGSLGGGDYREGRSDLDLIAVLDGPVTARTAWRVGRLHARLRHDRLADLLHCTYLTPATADDAERRHLTWAHGHLFRRPVTPVTRRELHTFGLVLHGEAPKALLPPVSDIELDAFVVRDQKEFWRPAVDRAHLWERDVWVDLGLLTFARATATLRDGRLISKREALDLLPALGAPAEVVQDIERRRYGGPGEQVPYRAELTRLFLGPAIDDLVATYG